MHPAKFMVKSLLVTEGNGLTCFLNNHTEAIYVEQDFLFSFSSTQLGVPVSAPMFDGPS